MRSGSRILIFLIFLGIVLTFNSSAAPALNEKGTPGLGEVQAQKEIPDGPPPSQEQKIVLDSFFHLRENGSRVWVERIIVTLVMAVPMNSLKHDLNSPTFRKIFYSLLQSGEPEATVKAQAVDPLNRHMGLKTDATVQISYSVLILR